MRGQPICPGAQYLSPRVMTLHDGDIGAHADMLGARGRERLPTDPVGTHTLTLTNVVVGSRIAVRDQAKTMTFYDQVAAAATVDITLNVYASGSGLNDWLIDVRKASAAPFYQRYKTLMSVSMGSSSHYVNQLPDQR